MQPGRHRRDVPARTPAPIGSTSTQDTIAPGLFAQLVAGAAEPRFDAGYPYSGLGQGPMAKVAFPNVNLAQIPTFEKKLQQWFKRVRAHLGDRVRLRDEAWEPRA
jgi:hypothetical protein